MIEHYHAKDRSGTNGVRGMVRRGGLLIFLAGSVLLFGIVFLMLAR